MKIDVIIPVYYTYSLLDRQLQSWLKIKGDWRLLICDNTPAVHRVKIEIPDELRNKVKLFIRDPATGIDGEKHGDVLDYMVSQTETSIISIQDCDFFWLDPDLLTYVDRYFRNGYRCVGTEIYYEAYDYVDERYPERHSSLSPCIFGMFVERKLALETTFIVTETEGKEGRETGWRLRERIMSEGIKSHVLPCIKHPLQKVGKTPGIKTPWFYCGNHGYIGVHLFGSTSYNARNCEKQLEEILENLAE